jgi:hypothetical protein
MKLLGWCVGLVLALAWVAEARADLITSYTVTGNVGATVAAYPTAGGTGPGTLNVSGIPAGSTILQATLYANNYFSAPATSATFAGNPLGPVSAFATNIGFNAYKFNVTSLVTGNGAYSANYSGPNNTYGLALAVVYSNPSLPRSTVSINDGAIDLGGNGFPANASTTFAGAGAGSGTVFLHTLADNALGQSGEVISFNGTPIGGPIDANLGNFASLFALPVTTLAGANTLSVADPADQFGIDLAVLVSPAAGGAAVPEPSSLALLALGGLALAGWRRWKGKRTRATA